MTNKKANGQKPNKTSTDKSEPNSLTKKAKNGNSDAHALAEAALSPIIGNAFTANQFVKGALGDQGLSESCDVILAEVEKIWNNDLLSLEATLTAQAITLDKIFNEMAWRAATNMGEYLNATETYMKLALKAQSQCRTTLQTLAEIKNPQPVNIVKQANIANGPQQINNGTQATESRAEKIQNQPNELLEVQHGSKMLDSRTTSQAGGSYTEMETVGQSHRAENSGRQSKSFP